MLLVHLTNDNVNQYCQQNIPTQDCRADNSSSQNLYKLQQVIVEVHNIQNSQISQSPEIGGVGIPPRQYPAFAFAFARDTSMLNQKTQLAQWQADEYNSRIETVYLQKLVHPITGLLKGVSMHAMITFLDQKYPAEPEEVEKQEALIRSN